MAALWKSTDRGFVETREKALPTKEIPMKNN